MRKQNILITLGLCVVLSLPSQIHASESKSLYATQIVLNDDLVEFPKTLPAVVNNGRVFVPVRFVEHPQIQGQFLFAKEQGTQSVSIYRDNVNIGFVLGQGTFRYRQMNGVRETSHTGDLEGAVPFLQGEEAMIPLRPFAEALGIEVKWDNRTKSALVITGEKYRSELESPEEWAEWVGEYPVEWDEEAAKAITEEELKAYIAERKLPIVDYKLVSKYEAVVLEVREDEASTYSIQRLRNGKLGQENMMISVGEDEEGISFKRSHGYMSVVVYDKAKGHRITSCVISVSNKGETKKLKFDIGDQRGYLLPLSEGITSGLINLYGEDGFVYEEIFW